MYDIKAIVFEEILKKYVEEEIMTKSEFMAAEREIFEKSDAKFEKVEEKFKWLIGTIIGCTGIILAALALLHK